MFRSGDVIFVTSNQATGYKQRKKYHICVCGYRGAYFFINSRTWVGSITISHKDLPALPNNESHIACNTVLKVSDDYMKKNGANRVGRLSQEVIRRLMEHVENCEVLNEDDKDLVIDGLSGAL